jgi:hypothetical protein
MEYNTRTIYGAYLQTVQLMQLPFNLLPYSTLNQKFSINESVVVPAAPIPFLNYFAIGNGGYSLTVGANNIPLLTPIQHLPTDAALYNQMPFVLRLPSNDLTPAQMVNYRLRTLVTYGNVEYVAYYLKTLNLNTVGSGAVVNTPSTLYNTVANGTTTSTAFIPTESNLNPTPPTILPGGAVSTNGNYVSAVAIVPVVLDAFDISEYQNVANIIYGSTDYAIISEMAICSGLDYTTTGVFNGTTQTYTDAIAVQIMMFLGKYYAVNFTTSGINIDLDIGALEPLFSLS